MDKSIFELLKLFGNGQNPFAQFFGQNQNFQNQPNFQNNQQNFQNGQNFNNQQNFQSQNSQTRAQSYYPSEAYPSGTSTQNANYSNQPNQYGGFQNMNGQFGNSQMQDNNMLPLIMSLLNKGGSFPLSEIFAQNKNVPTQETEETINPNNEVLL